MLSFCSKRLYKQLTTRGVTRQRLFSSQAQKPLVYTQLRGNAEQPGQRGVQDDPSIVSYKSLEEQAQDIQDRIDQANRRIEENTRKGRQLAERISQKVEENKFVKMQRFEIFISKMELLARSEQNYQEFEQNQVFKMQQAFVNSKTPLKDILLVYKQASVKGFDSSLAFNTLQILNQTLRARGNRPRAFDDYNMNEFDVSWRMQQLTGHLKAALGDDMYFNHHFLGLSSRQLGQMSHKDAELIQKQFDKLNQLLDQRYTSAQIKPLEFDQAVYGSFHNFKPRHHVFQGFDSNLEFREHLNTLMEWQIQQNDGLGNMGVTSSEEIQELENHLGYLVQSIHQIEDSQVNLQASFDAMRQQYFKLVEASDKHQFLQENKYIYYDLLQLEELLVSSGYISPEEAYEVNASQPHDVRMKRAAHIFYEYIQQYAPELMAEQYDGFIQAANDSKTSRTQPVEQVSLEEDHDKISVSSLSNSIIGLSQQALSFRRDATGKDYLHKFYEDHLTKDIVKDEGHPDFEHSWLSESFNVRMKQDYLKAYYVFEREVDKIIPRLKVLVTSHPQDVNGQLHALAALSACKHDASDLRSSIFENLNKLLSDEATETTSQALIDGLVGISMQSYQTNNSKDVAGQIIKRIDEHVAKQDQFTFDQKLDTLWGACALQLENSQAVKEFCIDLNMMNFQRTDNDLTFQQAEKVQDIMIYLTQVSQIKNQHWLQNSLNESLDLIVKNPEYHRSRFDEAKANYDPYHKRVLEGVCQGLSMASINHQVCLENNMFHMSDQNMKFNSELMPYKPDIIVGLNGQKVLLNVISAQQTMKDSQKADGQVLLRQRIVKVLNNSKTNMTPVETVSIPITAVVNYDIPELKLEVKEDYNFIEDIMGQMSQEGRAQSFPSNGFAHLAQFGARFIEQAANYIDSLRLESDKKRIDAVFRQVYKVFQIKHQSEKQFEKALQQQGLDQLKFELMKLSLYYEGLPKHLRVFIDQFVPAQFTSLPQVITDVKNSISQPVHNAPSPTGDANKLSQNWRGTRMEVELPVNLLNKLKKNIAPELINQRFMWVDDYFHYRDWEHNMKEVYDSFNLLVMPREKNSQKYFYDRKNHQRIVPQGIFPPPNHKRTIMVPQYQDQHEHQGSGDVLNQFEKEPYKMMVRKELSRSESLKPQTADVSFMTNLQNMKQGLKRDYSDAEIMDLLFKNLSFTDQLIEEHLSRNQTGKQETEPVFLQRDPSCYRDFIRMTYESKDQEDPFTHFYIKESGKIERIHQVKNQEMKEYEEFIKTSDNQQAVENTKNILKTLQDKMDDMIMENRNENEDFTSLSHHLNSEVKIKYDLKSLMKSDTVYDVDPELNDADLTDAAFLARQRKRAETKLIKSKIIYKMHNDMELSSAEGQYLKQWVSQLTESKQINMFNHRDSMLQSNFTQSTINDLAAEDVYALNKITNVDVDRDRHGAYGLSDLVLELSHVLDDEAINRVELTVMSDRLREEWQLPKDFQIIETRNKEIGILLNEVEELAWRTSGAINQTDSETLKKVLSVGRNKDYFDQQFYEQDMQSLLDFVNQANQFDDRIKLLEEWILRKEQEIKQRVVLPPKALQKSDAELHKIVDRDLKKAREALLGKLLTQDEFGNEVSAKGYNDLTTRDLSRIAESISVRLHIFNGEYPEFMPQTVKAILEHPNLSMVDYDKLNTFSRMFELDWRGDRSIANKNEFLATKPIYINENDKSNIAGYEDLGRFELSVLMKYACTPFVEDLSSKLINKTNPK